MFSTDFIFRQQENLVDNQKCWAGFRPLCNKILLLRPDIAKSLPCWLSQFRKAELRQPSGQRLSNIRVQQKKSIGPILFLYYEESLVSSNLNSKQLRFHGAHPRL